MYRLMLVEDEKLVRDSIIEHTAWAELGFEVVGSCSDGREAIEKLNQIVPDVVITDICMPFVDGLELASYIKTYFPDVVVVILTGYGEFEYAQRALKLRVFDFVLKPILPKEFDALLVRIRKELESRGTLDGSRRESSDPFTHTLNEVLFRWILRGEVTETQLQTVSARTGYVIDGAAYGVLMIKLKQQTAMTPPEKMQRLRETAERIRVTIPESECAVVDHYCIMMILSGETVETVRKEIQQCCKALISEIGSVTPIYIGVGDVVTSITVLHQSAIQAVHALGYAFSHRTELLVDATERTLEEPIPYKEMRASEKAVARELERKNYQNAKEEAIRWIRVMMGRNIHRDTALPSLKRVEIIIDDFLMKYDLMIEQFHMGIDEMDDILQVQERLLRKIDCVSMVDDEHVITGMQYVEKAKAYIQARYNDYQFSLPDLLEYLNVSKSYFCPLFKEKVGLTYSEYITSLRIEQAKLLLRTTNMYTSEIAAKVGFLDTNYFSVTFKRNVGMTPTQYRKEPK